MPSMLGFTFGFGAQDRGLKSAFGSVQSSLTNVSNQVSKLGGIARSVDIGAMFAGFGTAGLSRISDQLDKIVGGNENLVNGLESTMIASKKAARVIGAQAGMMGKDLDKFTSSSASLAYGMNLGIDQVAKAQKTYTRLSDDFRKGLNKSGIDLKAFLRAEEATGITSEDLMKNLNSLSGSFGFTGEQAGSFLDKFTATVMAGGQGSVAFGTMKETLDNLKTSLQQNTKFLGLDAAAQQKYVEDQILGAQRLAGTLSKTMKMDPADAQAAASAFMNKMNEEQVNISKMMAGIQEGAYGDLFTKIASETGMNVADVFVGKSPDEALKMLLKIRESLSGMGERGQMAITRLNDAFAQIAPQMQVGLFDEEKSKELVTNLDSISASTDKAKGSFDKFGKAAYTSGLSAADGVSRAKDAFESALLGVGGGAQGYANEQIKAYGGVTDKVKELASDKTWGPLTKRFALASRVGVGAFFLPMKQEGDALKNQYASISESMGKGGLAGRFEAIRQLGVAGLFLNMTKASTEMGGAVDEAQGKTLKLYEKFLMLDKAFKQFLPVILGVAGAIGAVFGVFKLATGVLSPILSLGSAMWRLTFATMGFAASIIGWPATVFLAIIGFIALWQSLPDKVKEQLDKMLGMASEWVNKFTVSLMAFDSEKFVENILEMLDGVAKAIKGFFTGETFVPDKDASGAAKLGAALGTLLTTAWTTVVDTLKGLLKGMWENEDIKKYLTIPLGVALAAPLAGNVAGAMLGGGGGGGGKGGKGEEGLVGGLAKKGFGNAKTALTKGRDAAALANVATLKAAQSEALVFAAQMEAAGGAQATLAATQMAQINAAVASAESAAAATSIYGTAMTAITNFLAVLGGGSAAAGGAVGALIVGSIVAGATAAFASPEAKKAMSKGVDGMLSVTTSSLDAIGSWFASMGPKVGAMISGIGGFFSFDWLNATNIENKVNEGLFWLFNIGQKFIDSLATLDLTRSAMDFVAGIFNDKNMESATAAIDWIALFQGIGSAIYNAIKAVLGGAGFVLEVIGAIVLKLGDALLAVVVGVFGMLGGLLMVLGKKTVASIGTYMMQAIQRLAELAAKATGLLPESIGGGMTKSLNDLAASMSAKVEDLTHKSERAAQATADAANSAALSEKEAADKLLQSRKEQQGKFSEYFDNNLATMLSRIGVDAETLTSEQQVTIANRLAAQAETYAQTGKEFSEKAGQRLLAGVVQGFSNEMNTASGILMGMGVDDTLTEGEVTDRLGRFSESLDDSIRGIMDAQNIIYTKLTDEQRKKLEKQNIQFTELTDTQRQFIEDQLTSTATKMAQSGKDFSAEAQRTLVQAIIDAMQTKDALDKVHKEGWNKYGMLYDPAQDEPSSNFLSRNYVPPVADKAASAVGGVASSVAGLAGGAFDAGKGVLSATADGLKAGAPVVTDALTEAMNTLSNKLPKKGKAMPAESPLVNVKDSGVQIMAEIARGMQEGAVIMVAAMTDAMTKVKDEMYLGITDIYNTMAGNFEFIGRRASQAFTTGVILEQELEIGALKQQLTDLLLGEFANNIKVVDVSGEAGTATLSVDSARTLSDQILGLKNALVVELQAIRSNTLTTAENTKPLRGNVGIAFVAQGAKG